MNIRAAFRTLFAREQPAPAPKPNRAEAIAGWQQMWNQALAQVRARYDAAANGDNVQLYWANADSFDADSAHRPEVRHRLRINSRYEMANNGYADGIGQTYATDLVGGGPSLKMQSGNPNYNRMVEREFWSWCKAIGFRAKLWTMAHAKHVDGEAFAILRRNPNVNHAIKLDLQLVEADQCATPMLMPGERGKIDGIRFDDFGNKTAYEFLLEHPGADGRINMLGESELVPASQVCHWLKVRRPGQHRAVPECSSTLNLGGVFRRGREAQLGTWEKIAAWTLLLETAFEPEEIQGIPAMSQFEIAQNMMTALPNSVKPHQLRAEHPGATYDMLHKLTLNEQARPKSMPYNKAACDSSSYNYSSGRLDHLTYNDNLDVDRFDCDDQVLEKVFIAWYDLAIVAFGWLGGNPEAVGPAARYHMWDWPQHRAVDLQAEADSNDTKLRSCQVFPHRLFTDAGQDFEDELESAAQSFGIPVEEMRQHVLTALYAPKKQNGDPRDDAEPADQRFKVAADELLSRLNGRANGHNHNGASHAGANAQ